MHFVLIPIAALTVYAQAAPQFNNFNSRDWRSTGAHRQDEGQTNNENHNQKVDVIRQDFTSQSTFAGDRGSNGYGRQMHENYQGSSTQCWDPVDQNYRDRESHPPHTHHPDQFYNDNYRNPYPEDHYHGPQRGRFEPQPPPYHRGHGPPQHQHQHHHHEHRPPPGGPHHHHRPPPHNHYHHHGPPPQNHGYGHPPHYHQHGPSPLPPRPPRPSHNGNEYELEICEETTKENNVFENPETSTSADSDILNIPSSPPVSSSSITPEILTESTSGKFIESTTQFDWNNYFPEANRGSENTDGIGLIDVRISDVEPV